MREIGNSLIDKLAVIYNHLNLQLEILLRIMIKFL